MRFVMLLAILLGYVFAQEDRGPKENLNPLIQCDPEIENCALKEEFGITNQVERNFLIMGIQAWIRAFTGPHLFVFLP